MPTYPVLLRPREFPVNWPVLALTRSVFRDHAWAPPKNNNSLNIRRIRCAGLLVQLAIGEMESAAVQDRPYYCHPLTPLPSCAEGLSV